ncbi:putative bifunctional diguanylate cyclase/phosphodiesterase [Paranoxybacillus vitaminiphilus]|nr:GGDEF domain-containing phosphodiesterase [Anoxybacillus vitaminiphilus]
MKIKPLKQLIFAVLLLQVIFACFEFFMFGEWKAGELARLLVLIAALLFVVKALNQLNEENQRLKKRRDEFEQTFNSVKVALWSFDVKTSSFLFSSGVSRIFGYNSEYLSHNTNAWREAVYPKDVKKVRAFEERLLRGEPATIEFRVIHPNSEIRWLRVDGTPVFDREGRLVKVNGIILDITEVKSYEEKIDRMAHHDLLTGLPNRYYLKKYLASLVESHVKKQLAILFIDLDRFKVINDTQGHTFGDILLEKVTERLQNCLSKNDFIVRYGGDEFIIVLQNVTREKVSHMAETIIERFAESFVVNGLEVFTTPSIGISMYPEDGRDIDTLIKNADAAMYLAKERGKNNYQFYNSSLHEKNEKKMRIEGKLRKALEHNEFVLYYQPKIELSTNRLVGVEALIRWYNKELGFVSPADFIPIAEELGLIIPIGKWILREACRQCVEWQQLGFKNLSVAVNISPRQFKDPSFIQTVVNILEETGLSPHYLELEITESIMEDIKRSRAILEKLKQVGVKVAIDDFGTGYSSLHYLCHLPINTIKIDKSFVDGIHISAEKVAILQTIIDMGHRLQFEVVAEGIETRSQVDFLVNHSCQVGQGYYFNKPLSVNDFEKWYIAQAFANKA